MKRHRVLAAEEGLPPVIMFAFDDYFPAVAATDLLVRTVLRNGLDVSPVSVIKKLRKIDAPPAGLLTHLGRV